MSWFDFLKEVPLSEVMRERVALAEQKLDNALAEAGLYKARSEQLARQVADLEAEIAELRSASGSPSVGSDTMRVLHYLFRARGDDRDVGQMAYSLKMERGVAEYHLDELKARGLARCSGGNYLHGHVYWDTTAEGRRLVVEANQLAS
jgi:DNA-binding MarR family transcriptional regulator